MASRPGSPQNPPRQPPSVPAGPPFDDRAADLTLRTTDGVDFRVSKNILSFASQALANKANSGVRGVVDFAQDSESLDFALRHIYPVPLPTHVTLSQVRLLAEFAKKFEVKALESLIARYLTDALDDDPIGVYSIAITYGHNDIAANAARSSLKHSIFDLLSSQLEITGESYKDIIKYHAECGAAASAVAFERKWFPPWDQWGRLIWTSNSDGSSNIRCPNCATSDPVCELPVQSFWPAKQNFDFRDNNPLKRTRLAPWRLWNYLQRSSSILAHHPTAKAVSEEGFVLEKPFDCSSCPLGTREDILEFSRIFAMEVEKAVEKVSLPKRVKDA
ncbi:hypothetical protein BGW80DRAFT_1250716 [Lactifluus volemus]|nr:hypothetical protein BGW80DRAFT_1250716 [Lactifluus volemus]